MEADEDQGLGVNEDLGHLYLFGAVDMSMGAVATEFVLDMDTEEPKALKVFVCSHGGDPQVGWALHDLLRSQHRVREVVTIGTGVVESAGLIIYMGGVKRVAWPSARFMMHGCKGNVDSGGQQTLLNMAEDLGALDSKMAVMLDEMCGGHLSLAQWRAYLRDEQLHTFSAKEAYDMGMATKLEEWTPMHRVSQPRR